MKSKESPQSLVFDFRMRKSLETSPIKKSPPKITKQYCKPSNRIPLRSKIKPSTSEIHIQQCATEEPMSPRTHQRSAVPGNEPYISAPLKTESSIPTQKIVQRIKMNLSLLEYKMKQLLEQQTEEETVEKVSGKKSGQPKIERSTSRKKLQKNQKFEGCLTDRKKLERASSYKAFNEKGWR